MCYVYTPSEDLEQAGEIAAVEAALATDRLAGSDVLGAYCGRLSDGTDARLFALQSPEEKQLRAEFDRLRSEWETCDGLSNVTTVHASGDEPIPWIAVERPPGQRFLDVAPTLSPIERRNVLAEIAETLWRVDTPHLVPTPDHIRIERGEGLDIRVDWAIGRVPLHAGEYSENPYVAPELREDPTAGDERSDVYTLGALARYAVTEGEPKLEPGKGRRDRRGGYAIARNRRDDRATVDTTQWLSSQAMSPDPEKRFQSCYAFKRGALFGHSGRTAPESKPDESGGGAAETAEPTSADADSESAAQSQGDNGRTDPRGRARNWERPRRETDGRRQDSQRAVSDAEHGWNSHRNRPDGSSADVNEDERGTGWSGRIPRWLDPDTLSRRQIVGGAGVALLGIAGLEYWNGRDPDPIGGAGSKPQPEIGVEFDAGMIELTNTGVHALDPERLFLSGDGFLSTRGQQFARYTDDEMFAPGSVLRLAADPAYELEVYYGRDDPVRLAESEGPEAAERDPRPGKLYTPDLEFHLETEREDRLLVEYTGGATVRADQIRFAGVEFGGAPALRWSERADLDNDHWLSRGEFTRVAIAPETVLRVEWAPHQTGETTTVAQYEGPARPLNGERGGIEGPRYDEKNTAVASAASEVRDEPTEAWSVTLADSPGESLAIASGRLFASAGRYLYALDSEDGEVLWRRYVGSNVTSEPAVHGGTVFVGAAAPEAPSTMYAFDVTDGSTKWEFTTDATALWPATVTENLLFTGGTGPDGDIYALDTRDGTSDTTVGGVTQVRFSAFERPYLYIRGIDGDIKAVVPGRVEWSYPAERMASPTVTDGVVYGGDSGTGQLFALDAADGSEQWTVETDGNPNWPQAVTAETVFTGTDRGMVHAVDADSGEIRWSVESEDRFVHGPVAAGETVYIAGSGSLSALASEGGRNRWTLDFERRLVTEPAVSGGWLYLGFVDGRISAFEG